MAAPLSREEIRRNKLLKEAEGYVELQMPSHALECLNAVDQLDIELEGDELDLALMLRGEALRMMEKYYEALQAFEYAHSRDPDRVNLLLAMAWCYKRDNRLPDAIDSAERAYHLNPKSALILYNLACYYTLAKNKEKTLSWLGRALRMDASYRDKIADEPDFNSLRNDPDFQKVVGLTSDNTASPAS